MTNIKSFSKLTETQLLKMELHEIVYLEHKYVDVEIFRVVGGWIYRPIGNAGISTTFVPEKNN